MERPANAWTSFSRHSMLGGILVGEKQCARRHVGAAARQSHGRALVWCAGTHRAEQHREHHAHGRCNSGQCRFT
eukprot:scaffold10084_cov139-Isochrysis_galbana.AAC.7